MGVWSQGPENMCLKCFTNAARLCRLRPPTPGAWAGPLSWFILRATPASLTKCHGLRCLRVSLKEATGQEFLAFSVLEHLRSVLVLSTQASKPKSNITILGGKKKKSPAVFTSNKSKCQEKSTDFIKSGMWPGGNTLLGLLLRIPTFSISAQKLLFFLE